MITENDQFVIFLQIENYLEGLRILPTLFALLVYYIGDTLFLEILDFVALSGVCYTYFIINSIIWLK